MNNDSRRCLCGEAWGQHREGCPYPEYDATKAKTVAWVDAVNAKCRAEILALDDSKGASTSTPAKAPESVESASPVEAKLLNMTDQQLSDALYDIRNSLNFRGWYGKDVEAIHAERARRAQIAVDRESASPSEDQSTMLPEITAMLGDVQVFIDEPFTRTDADDIALRARLNDARIELDALKGTLRLALANLEEAGDCERDHLLDQGIALLRTVVGDRR